MVRLLANLVFMVAVALLCTVAAAVALGAGWGLSVVAPVTPYQGAVVVLGAAAVLALFSTMSSLADTSLPAMLHRLGDGDADDVAGEDSRPQPLERRRPALARRTGSRGTGRGSRQAP
jgi:hypothetical protein